MRRMPPLSSPVPRLSSAPSDVYTVHTIASRSPPHPLATSHRVREGRPPRPVQGDAIATPRHHIASEQQPQGIASTFCHPARLVHVLFLSSSSSHPSGGKGRAPSQPGRATPSRSPFRHSPPCRGASAYMRTPPKVGEGVVSTYQGGGARRRESLSRDFLRGCIALNINYLFSPLGYAVQRQYIGEMVIVLKV